MSTLGIDPSVNRPAFALWPERKTWQLDVIGEGAQRLLALYSAVHDWATLNPPPDLEAVFIERPRGRWPNQHLDYATGVIQVAVLHGLSEHYPHPVSLFEVSTGEWKRRALGNGAAKKDEVFIWANCQLDPAKALERAMEGPASITQDEADALAIARAGSCALEEAA